MKGNKNTHFVKGQKLIRIDYDGLAKEKIGEIYTFNGYSSQGLALIDEDKGYKNIYYSERFETIIQSLDDVVKGMELTVKKDLSFINRKGFITKGREKTTKIIVSYLSKYHDNSVVCVEKDFWLPIECFEEYQPKEQVVHHITGIQDNSIENLTWVNPSDNKRNNKMEKEYKVINSFTLKDILNKNPCNSDGEVDELIKEYSEYGMHFDFCFDSWGRCEILPTLKKYSSWLIQEGFVKEVEKDVVLKPGMKVKSNINTYLIDINYRFIQLDNGYICLRSGMKTLSELEENYPYESWSIVNE